MDPLLAKCFTSAIDSIDLENRLAEKLVFLASLRELEEAMNVAVKADAIAAWGQAKIDAVDNQGRAG